MSFKKLGLNKYEIREDYAVLFMDRRNGQRLECLIDLEDLERLKVQGWHWSATWSHHIQGYYVTHSEYMGVINGKGVSKDCYLHRWLVNPEGRNVVDHINHNTLDNRRKINLRETSQTENIKNRKGANKNNRVGYRNVSWNSGEHCWTVQLTIDGRNKRLGKFDDPEEAGIFAEAQRLIYYPH